MGKFRNGELTNGRSELSAKLEILLSITDRRCAMGLAGLEVKRFHCAQTVEQRFWCLRDANWGHAARFAHPISQPHFPKVLYHRQHNAALRRTLRSAVVMESKGKLISVGSFEEPPFGRRADRQLPITEFAHNAGNGRPPLPAEIATAPSANPLLVPSGSRIASLSSSITPNTFT
jgi:hypothetical protein